jgi:dephospho-CoA kinase
MIIIGLTGSIGMGKSFVATCFKQENIGVFDADEQIHLMMQDGGEATPKVAEIFPEVVAPDGSIDRAKLGGIVFAHPPKLLKLEKILHPMVREKGEKFVDDQLANNAAMMVQDIPLLYETGADKECHVVIVVSAPLDVQQQRVMQRDNMTDGKYQAILKLQLLQKEKEQRADFVINTDCDKEDVREQVKDVIAKITANY